MKGTEKLTALLRESKTHWRTPPAGKYMPYREIISYSVGGIGAYFIFTMAQTLLLSTTNVIIGNTIGIQPMHMYAMYLISVVTNIPLTMLRANMIDNVRYKTGKYRPYLLRMGVPTVAVSMLFVFTPYSKVAYLWRCVLIFIYNFGLQFFYNFFYDAYENLIHVLSPDSQERTDATAIKSFIYSLAPTITNFITPLIAGKVADGNMYDLRVYQWFYPFIAVFGVALILLVYSGTEEKIVIAKTHVMKVRFSDALREVAKNKYFWIISLAGWLGFLETCTSVILQWLYNYAKLCTPEQYAAITLIRGSAYTWGMVLAPFAIRRWGKKSVLLVTNALNVVFLALVYPLMGSIWTVLLCMYFNSIADSFMLVLNPAIQADIRDYQQYKSGERIDGMFGAVAMIGGFVTMATSSVLPAVYEKYGIFNGNGYENMYDVLYDQSILYHLVGALVILSAVGALLNMLPYFFYDLTEAKQKGMIRILQIRAMFEDYGNGVLTDGDMIKTMEMIGRAKSLAGKPIHDLKQMKKDGVKGKALAVKRKENEEIQIAKAVINELERFSLPTDAYRLNWAKEICSRGIGGIAEIQAQTLAQAKALPGADKEERSIRKQAIADAKLSLRSKKAAQRYYPDGIAVFDEAGLRRLYEEEAALAEQKQALLKNKPDKDRIHTIDRKISDTVVKIKEAEKTYQQYADSTKVYHDAQRIVKQAENYARFEELSSRYKQTAAES